MRVHVLGSAAGGGFPQWNCGCANCDGVRRGVIAARPRTQESLAISADGERWFLLNASPEVRAQIESFPALHPRGLRATPLAGVVLTNGDLDHCLGLLSLRESQRLVVYATARTRQSFVGGNGLYRTLERFPGQIEWRQLALGEATPLITPGGEQSGLRLRAFSVPGKPPLHAADPARHPEDNIGLRVEDERSGATLAYLSGVAGHAESVRACSEGAHALFFDGTFWAPDELIALGVGERTAADMAHWPVGGDCGSLEFLRGLAVPRKFLIHVNNTNPLLREDSTERASLRAAGLELAHDGMELLL